MGAGDDAYPHILSETGVLVNSSPVREWILRTRGVLRRPCRRDPGSFSSSSSSSSSDLPFGVEDEEEDDEDEDD